MSIETGINAIIKEFFESLEYDLPECDREALTSLIVEFLTLVKKERR